MDFIRTALWKCAILCAHSIKKSKAEVGYVEVMYVEGQRAFEDPQTRGSGNVHPGQDARLKCS